MTNAIPRTNTFQTGLLVAAAAVLLVVALPVLAFLSLGARLLVPVALLGAAVVILLSPSLRRRLLFAEPEPDVTHKGLRIPDGLLVHQAHAWARMITGTTARVGVDDLAQRALGPVERVDLPTCGSHVAQGDVLFTLHRGDRSIQVRAPLAGTVLETNDAVTSEAGLVNRSPYDEGWVVRIAATDLERGEARLMRGRKVGHWFRSEIDRFLGAVSPQLLPSPALPDGGALSEDLHGHLDDETWAKVTKDFFDATV